MPQKEKPEPSMLDVLKTQHPQMFEKPPTPKYSPAPTNLDFMSEAERHAASSKGGQTTQSRRHADKVASPDASRRLAALGLQWKEAKCRGENTSDVEQAIGDAVQPCFRNGVPNEEAVMRLNKYAQPLRIQQHGEAVHVELMLFDSTPEIIVKSK